MAKLSRAFRYLKPHSDSFSPKSLSISNPSKLILCPSSSASSPEPEVSSASAPSRSKSRSSAKNPWSVYLILSTNPPIKTYVGVTNNFSRRLKQHNGELRGGAKASRVGRPWVCACLINGFSDKSEACQFESKWKLFSRKSSRKRKATALGKQAEDSSLPLLLHRHAALSRVQSSIACSHLDIGWRFDLP